MYADYVAVWVSDAREYEGIIEEILTWGRNGRWD